MFQQQLQFERKSWGVRASGGQITEQKHRRPQIKTALRRLSCWNATTAAANEDLEPWRDLTCDHFNIAYSMNYKLRISLKSCFLMSQLDSLLLG